MVVTWEGVVVLVELGVVEQRHAAGLIFGDESSLLGGGLEDATLQVAIERAREAYRASAAPHTLAAFDLAYEATETVARLSAAERSEGGRGRQAVEALESEPVAFEASEAWLRAAESLLDAAEAAKDAESASDDAAAAVEVSRAAEAEAAAWAIYRAAPESPPMSMPVRGTRL